MKYEPIKGLLGDNRFSIDGLFLEKLDIGRTALNEGCLWVAAYLPKYHRFVYKKAYSLKKFDTYLITKNAAPDNGVVEDFYEYDSIYI